MFTPPSRGLTHGSVTPLLAFVAGDFAPEVARAWPAPHAVFLTAPAERRHLVCLALHRSPELFTGRALDALLTDRFRDALRHAVPDAPEGLRAVLGKLGETAWRGTAYDGLLRLLRIRGSAKRLLHAEEIAAATVLSLAKLPDAALAGGVGRLDLTRDQAAVLAEALDVIRRTRGAAAEAAAVRRWASVGDAEALFEAAVDELHPELPAPPFAGTPRLRPIGSKAALRQAAARYRNCLRTAVGRAASGRSAFYEWQGRPPVVVELALDDLLGWRLDEAKLTRNATVPPRVREPIIAELRSWGVHVGRSSRALENQLWSAQEACFAFAPEQAEIAELFGEY